MHDLAQIRSGKPGCCPDQSIYAQYACAEFGLAFTDLDGGSGLVFSVASKTRRMNFGAGRCSWYPQNNATAATLASDKYFTNVILERAGVATLGGEYEKQCRVLCYGPYRAWAQVQADLVKLQDIPASNEPEPFPTYGEDPGDQ